MNQSIENDVLTLTMEKNLLSTTVVSLREKCKQTFTDSSFKEMVIDLAKIDTIDSKGLNFLIGLYKECSQRNILFRITGTSPELRQLFAFVRLIEKFNIS